MPSVPALCARAKGQHRVVVINVKRCSLLFLLGHTHYWSTKVRDVTFIYQRIWWRWFSLEKLPLFISAAKLFWRLSYCVIALWSFPFSWANSITFCLGVLSIYCSRGIPCLFVSLLLCHNIFSLTWITYKSAHDESCNLICFSKLHMQLPETFPFHWSTSSVAQDRWRQM